MLKDEIEILVYYNFLAGTNDHNETSNQGLRLAVEVN